MKKIFRKNQLVITALALMIAVAGYFSYMNNNMDDGKLQTAAEAANAEVSAGELEEDYDISDEDVLQNEIFTAEEPDGTETAAVTDGSAETAAGTEGEPAAEGTGQTVADGTAGAEEVVNPGEAVLTSTTVANIDYASEMKLNREQIRSKNKETLLEIVNNNAISDELKQDAINKMIAMTDIAERENAAEMLLEAKGFTDVVVSITEDSCDVVLNMGEVTDAKRAQVEDIVKRKTNVSAENVIITPIVVGEVDTEYYDIFLDFLWLSLYPYKAAVCKAGCAVLQ